MRSHKIDLFISEMVYCAKNSVIANLFRFMT